MQTLQLLDRLIGFETVTRTSNLALVDFAEAHLKSCGFTVTRLPSPCGTRAALHARIGPAGDGILLSAHTDVVPVAGQDWTRPPFKLTREGDRLFGRGTTDMKGYVAAMLSLAERAAQADLTAPLQMVLSYDEEVGCVGIQDILPALAPLIGQPRACFVGEPTQMQVAVGHKGKAALRATCHGQSGHSALAPTFVNALHLATEFISGLREIQAHYAQHGAQDPAYSLPYSTFHAGVLKGGTALNIVPDMAELTFEYRHLAADSPDGILTRLTDLAAGITARHQATAIHATPAPRVEIDQYNAYPGLDVDPGAAVTSLAQRLAQSNNTIKVAFGTEAGVFDQLGVPTVVCGPGSMEGQGHKPDEYLDLSELVACDQMMDRILAELVA